MAPVAVKLADDSAVEPDVVVVCDPNQIKETHIEGAPTLVVEVASPSTAHHDRIRKMGLYARYGITEYWIVTPYPPSLEIFVNEGTAFCFHSGFDETQTLTSPTFPELEIELRGVFDFPVPPKRKVQRVREGHPPYGSDTGMT